MYIVCKQCDQSFEKMIKKIILGTFSLIILFILFSQGYINNFFVTESGSGAYFADWQFVVNAIKCKSSLQTCPLIDLGGLFLLLPYTDKLNQFYQIFPILLIILFVFYVIKIIELKNSKYAFLSLLLIFNPSSILALERANTDVIFFIILLFICYSRFFWANAILINISFLAKYYPITFFINFLIEKKDRSNFTSLLLIILSFFICIAFIYFDEHGLKAMVGSPGETHFRTGAGWGYLFSVKAIPRILKYLFDFNYIVLLIFFYSFFIFLTIKFYKFFKKSNIFKSLTLYNIEDRFFILGINTLLLCFLLFSNYYYREIFLILSLPLLIKLKNQKESKEINYIFIFIILRYLFLFIYNYIMIQETHYFEDNQRIFHNSFLFIETIKGILDFVLISVLSSFLIHYNTIILKKLFFFTLQKNPE